MTPEPEQEPTKRVHAFGERWAEQMGDGYELQTFNKAKYVPFFQGMHFFQRLKTMMALTSLCCHRGALEITRTVLPKWLGGSV